MLESTSKEKILKNIRSALIQKKDNPYPKADFESDLIPIPEGELPEIILAENLISEGTNFVFCDDLFDLVENLLFLCNDRKWKKITCNNKVITGIFNECQFPYWETKDGADLAVVACEGAIANTGMISVPVTACAFMENASSLALILFSSQVHPSLKYYLASLKKMEKQHQPISHFTCSTTQMKNLLKPSPEKELFLFLIDENGKGLG